MVHAILTPGFTLRDAQLTRCYGSADIGLVTLRIINKIFGRREDWHEVLFSDMGPELSQPSVLLPDHKNLDPARPCGAMESSVFPVNSLIAIHTEDKWHQRFFLRQIGTYSNRLYFYHTREGRRIQLCKAKPGIINPGITVEWMTKLLTRVTLANLEKNTSAIDCIIRPEKSL
jgi:hypothetical protein